MIKQFFDLVIFSQPLFLKSIQLNLKLISLQQNIKWL